MTASEDRIWREIARRLGPPGKTGLERGAVFDPDLFEPDADSLLREAERLRKAFERGDMLAPFECCSIWAEAGLDSALLPGWARDQLFEISAKYYDAGPFKENHRSGGEAVRVCRECDSGWVLPQGEGQSGTGVRRNRQPHGVACLVTYARVPQQRFRSGIQHTDLLSSQRAAAFHGVEKNA